MYEKELEELVKQFKDIESNIQLLLTAREQTRGKITILKELMEKKNAKNK